MQYKKPKLIDLEFSSATGDCGAGSNPADSCAANGGSASNFNCGPTGNAAAISCITGTDKS